MHTIAVAGQKGGIGKTTTSVNLAAGLALQGHRVLLVDLDPQHNATAWLGVDGGRRLYEWFSESGQTPLVDIVEETAWDGLSLVPSSDWLYGIDKVLRNEVVPQGILRKGLEHLAYDAFDWVILDTPPDLGLLTVNALTAADSVLTPATAHVMSLGGLAMLHDTIDKVREGLNPGLNSERVLVCRVDARTNHSKDVQAELKRRFGRNCLETYVRENVSVAEAFGHAKPVFDYEPKSTGAEDYYALAQEVAESFTKRARRGARKSR